MWSASVVTSWPESQKPEVRVRTVTPNRKCDLLRRCLLANCRPKWTGSQGGIGDAAAASASTDSQVWVKGASSYAMFGQSATGNGDAHAVTLTAGGSLFAQGADSVAVYGESTAEHGKGNIAINLNGDRKSTV